MAQGPESVATDETLSGFGHDDIDAGPEFNQFRDYVGGLICRDRT